jgi:hypothetical protein
VSGRGRLALLFLVTAIGAGATGCGGDDEGGGGGGPPPAQTTQETTEETTEDH